MHTMPTSYAVKNALIYKDEEGVPFNIATNPTVNCFKPLETYKSLMPNVEVVQTDVMQSYSVDTFLENLEKKELSWLIIDTFTSLDILSYAEVNLETLEVLVCNSLSDTSEELHAFMSKNGFLLLKRFEDNNPKVGIDVYVKDFKNSSIRRENEKVELEKKLDEFVAKIGTLEQENKTLKAQVEVSQKESSHSSNLANALSEEKEELKRQVEKLHSECSKYKKLADVLQNEQQKTIADNENIHKELKVSKVKENDLSAQLVSQKDEFDKALKEYEEKKLELEHKVNVLSDELKKLKVEHKSLIDKWTLSEEQYTQTEYIINQIPKEASYDEVVLVALSENALTYKKYQQAIYYWQKLASILGSKMSQLYYKRLAFSYSRIGGYPLGTEEEEKLNGSYDKHDALQQLHQILNPNFYLEIGVQTGKSLRLAKCKALGIDPMPLLSEELKINMEVQTQTSDAFFAMYAKNVLTEPLDLVFIDGMHLFEYALRDFMNVESYANKNTTIVIDDIYPGHRSQASRDRKTRAWTGDVWKVLAILKKYRKDLEIVTLDIYPTGLMIIQNLDKNSTVLADNYDKIVKKYVEKKIDEDIYIKRKGSLDPNVFFR